MMEATPNILVQSQRVVFRRRDIPLVGLLWLPSRFISPDARPAIVLATPGSAVRERVGEAHARRLVELGHLALTFDPSFQGESGGRPRGLDDPQARIDDLGAAVDFLASLAFVDGRRIGVLALGSARDHAAAAARADRRIRAVGHLAAVGDTPARPGEASALTLALLRMEALLSGPPGPGGSEPTGWRFEPRTAPYSDTPGSLVPPRRLLRA